mgnify:CR=1 FL=1
MNESCGSVCNNNSTTAIVAGILGVTVVAVTVLILVCYLVPSCPFYKRLSESAPGHTLERHTAIVKTQKGQIVCSERERGDVDSADIM